MSEKARLFRSLLLEPLECRAVFSVDGLEVQQFSHHSLNFEFDAFQPVQFPHSESAGLNNGFYNKYIGRPNDFHSVFFNERRPTNGVLHHRDRFESDLNLSLPPPEGESRPFDASSSGFDLNSLPAQVPTQTHESHVVVFVDTSSVSKVISQPSDFSPASIPRAQVDSNNANRPKDHPIAGGISSSERALTFNSLNSAIATPVDATRNAISHANLAAMSLSTLPTGITNLDFSQGLGNNRERSAAIGLGLHRASEFHFTRPQSAVADSIFDQTLIERSAGVESLGNLLTSLAENHRRSQIQNGFDADQPNFRNEQNWRPEQTAASVEILFSDGGMIALALNRDIALRELEDISDDARNENNAWIANVGIFRAFENAAVAVTEYAGLTNRIARDVEPSSTTPELPDVEGEVANTQLNPWLASTSAALGVVMIGLRRIRKSVPLMFTSRRR